MWFIYKNIDDFYTGFEYSLLCVHSNTFLINNTETHVIRLTCVLVKRIKNW